jgi:E3 Ubiquitin ligase
MAGVFGGIYFFYRGFRILQRKRLIENTPTSTIRGAAMGLVEVNGLATGPHTIPAPITGIPSYYYRSVAWQLKRSGKNEHWEKVADESQHVPFFIDDNTGTVLVDPQGAEMDIHRDFSELYSNSLFSDSLGVPSNVGSFLARYGVDCDKKTKVEEFCIKPKNALFVLGTLSQNHGVNVNSTPVRTMITDIPKFTPGGPLFSFQAVLAHQTSSNGLESGNGGGTHVVRLSGNDRPAQSSDMTQQGRVASALLKAGISNPAAWAVAGVSDYTAPNATSSSGSAAAVGTALEPFDLHPPVVLTKGERNPDFFISWQSRRGIVKSLGWKSALMIWGGPLLTLVSAYIISADFGWF